MEKTEIMKRVIATNIPNYYITDNDCENLYYKSIVNGVCYTLIGPSSASIAKLFRDKSIKTGISISYPSGTAYPDIKAEEIISFEKENGPADMYFVTVAVGYFMSGEEENLDEEIKLCVSATRSPVYFFIEAAEMTDGQIEKVCETAKKYGAAGIVTSTSFEPYEIKRSTVEDVKRVKRYAGGQLEVVAFGEFGTVDLAEEVLMQGADKIILNGIDMLIYEGRL